MIDALSWLQYATFEYNSTSVLQSFAKERVIDRLSLIMKNMSMMLLFYVFSIDHSWYCRSGNSKLQSRVNKPSPGQKKELYFCLLGNS